MPRAAATQPKKAAASKAKSATSRTAQTSSTTELSLFEKSVASLLDSCQHSYAVHPRCTAKAQLLFASDAVQFTTSVLSHLPRLLTMWHKSATTERVITFVSSLSATISPEEERRAFYLAQLSDFLLRALPATDKAVRYRSAQLLAALMKETQDGLTDALFNNMRDALTRRLRDKQPMVRAAACRALAFLQEEDDEDAAGDSDDADDDAAPQRRWRVTDTLLSLAELDSSPLVRKEALASAFIARSVGALVQRWLDRLVDPSPTVRRSIFQQLAANKVPFEVLSIQQRTTIIRVGLQDADDGSRRAAAALTRHWLAGFDNDLIRLIEKLGVGSYREVVEALLRDAFERGLHTDSATPSPPFPAHQLTLESSLYWALLCDCAAGREELMETLLPDTAVLCDALSMHGDNAGVLTNLLSLCGRVRGWDVAGRRRLSAALEDMAGDVEMSVLDDERLTEEVVRVLRGLCEGGEAAFLTQMSRVLQRLRTVPAGDGRPSMELLSDAHRERLKELHDTHQDLYAHRQSMADEYEVAMEVGDGARAETAAQHIAGWDARLQEVQEEEAEEEALLPLYKRLLKLVSATAANVQMGSAGASSLFLQQAAAIGAHLYVVADNDVHALAMKAIARCSLLTEDSARQCFTELIVYLPPALVAGDADDDGGAEGVEGPHEPASLEVQMVCIRAIVDMVVAYPSLLHSEEACYDEVQLAYRLLAYLDTADYDDGRAVGEALEYPFAVALEGLCKLLLFDRLPQCAPEVLEQLTSFYYHSRHSPLSCADPDGAEAHAFSLAQSLFDAFRGRYVQAEDDSAQLTTHVQLLTVGLLKAMRRMAYADPKHYPSLKFVTDSAVASLIWATRDDPARSREVQGKVIEEVLGYACAFPHSRLIKALVALLDKNVTPSVGAVQFMRQTLEQLTGQVKDRGAVKAMHRAAAAWRAVEEEEKEEVRANSAESVAEMQQRMEQRVLLWTRFDEAQEGVERESACKDAKKAKRDDWQHVDQDDDDDDDEDEEADANDADGPISAPSPVAPQETARPKRPVRESRAVAERRMEEERKKQREQDSAMKQREREEQASSDDDDEAVAEDAFEDEEYSDDSTAGNKENARAQPHHSRQRTLKGSPADRT